MCLIVNLKGKEVSTVGRMLNLVHQCARWSEKGTVPEARSQSKVGSYRGQVTLFDMEITVVGMMRTVGTGARSGGG